MGNLNQPRCTNPDCRAALHCGVCHSNLEPITAALDEVARLRSAEERLLEALTDIAELKSLTATPTQFYQHLQSVARKAITVHAMNERA